MSFVTWTKSHFKSEDETRFDVADKAAKDEMGSWRKVCAAVDARDKKQCRCCGRSHVHPDRVGVLHRAHRHHIVYRSAGGADAVENVVTLCAACHNGEHKHRLRIEGTGEAITVFQRDANGQWYISRQEIAPHVLVPRD